MTRGTPATAASMRICIRGGRANKTVSDNIRHLQRYPYDACTNLHSVKGLAGISMGDANLTAQIKSKKLMLTGERQIIGSAERWFPRSHYADVRPELNGEAS